jgi:hypothetical protein
MGRHVCVLAPRASRGWVRCRLTPKLFIVLRFVRDQRACEQLLGCYIEKDNKS